MGPEGEVLENRERGRKAWRTGNGEGSLGNREQGRKPGEQGVGKRKKNLHLQ